MLVDFVKLENEGLGNDRTNFVVSGCSCCGWKKVYLKDYSPENKQDIEKSPFSLGNTSSNAGFSIVILVFRGV